jgi:hypothetical protein
MMLMKKRADPVTGSDETLTDDMKVIFGSSDP